MSSNAKPDADKASTKSSETTLNSNPESDEKLYCICTQKAYGTMIACDNEACQIEWFHLFCVGLGNLPSKKSTWYCPSCRVKVGKGVLTDGMLVETFESRWRKGNSIVSKYR